MGHALVGERNDDEGEEGGDRVTEVVPVDLEDARTLMFRLAYTRLGMLTIRLTCGS